MPKKMEVSTEVMAVEQQAVGGMERGGVPGDWSERWNCARALAEFCVPPEAYKALNLRRKIEMELEDALDGRPARLNSGEDLRLYRAQLIKAIEQVLQRMGEIGLDVTQSMYPVLWLRLLREANVALEGVVYRQLGEWRLRLEAEGEVVFVSNESSADSRSSKAVVQGGKRPKYTTVEELLLRPPKSGGRSPYAKAWRLHVTRRPAQGVGPTTKSVPAKTTEPAVVRSKRKSRPRARILEDLKKQCGSGVVESVRAALKREAKSDRGLVVAVGEAIYRTDLSAGELLLKLRRYQELSGSDSTQRKALRAYVTLPRGRPPRKQPQRKKPR